MKKEKHNKNDIEMVDYIEKIAEIVNKNNPAFVPFR